MKDLRKLFDRAHDLWNSGDSKTDKHNRKAWIRSVLMLGDKWLLAKPVQRKEQA
jgi:hypothetical protein